MATDTVAQDMIRCDICMGNHVQSREETEKPCCRIHRSGNSSQDNKQFLNEIMVNFIKTGSLTHRICCLPNTDQYFIRSFGLMKRLDSKGSEHETVRTKSENERGIYLTVTRTGNLVYTDRGERSINLVQQGKIDTIVTLHDWQPLGICSTSSDGLLVVMVTENHNEIRNKVVRYTGSTVTQEIQFDDKRNPLYSKPSFIEENKNLQVCVSDVGHRQIVVTDEEGKLMFRYNGNFSSGKFKKFYPKGLATDSLCHMLVTDNANNCVHVINHEGKFLRYIECYMRRPCNVSISSDDILYIVDNTRKVKIIKYLQ